MDHILHLYHHDLYPFDLNYMYKDNYLFRLADHLSITIGGRIIRRLDGRANDDGINLSNESKATQALYLFKNGKKPINVCNIDYI